jgi:hypothetical protein
MIIYYNSCAQVLWNFAHKYLMKIGDFIIIITIIYIFSPYNFFIFIFVYSCIKIIKTLIFFYSLEIMISFYLIIHAFNKKSAPLEITK